MMRHGLVPTAKEFKPAPHNLCSRATCPGLRHRVGRYCRISRWIAPVVRTPQRLPTVRRS